MKRVPTTVFWATACMLAAVWGGRAAAPDRVKTANGLVEGTDLGGGIRSFKGIPFAAPPTGDLRWKAPQPVANWTAVRPANQFGPRCMQESIFGDMSFRSNGMSEDCLYLNVWTPAKSATERLPVLVYYYGGGYVAGDGSEPRYDGDSLARKGIVTLTVNYRLGVFGFLAHPELTKESPHGASGDYALLDQVAALQWVHQNIAAFGGDPARVTIGGESAGSITVSALMTSPLSKGLIAGAIGESGALINPTLPPVPLAQGEQEGVKFAKEVGVQSIGELRAKSAADIEHAAASSPVGRFAVTVDGYVLPRTPVEILAAGDQAHVPLLAGWNSEEQNARAVLGNAAPTPENFAAALQKLYGEHANEAMKVFPGATTEQVLASATALASARFTAYSTWKWTDLQAKTGGHAVYRYYYSHPRPAMNRSMGNATAGLAGGVIRGGGNMSAPPPPSGAVHSAEIEYALGNLDTNTVYAWTPADTTVSTRMEGYFANFIKTGDPNGQGLPTWPANHTGSPTMVMHIDVTSKAEPDTTRDQFVFLDQFYAPTTH